ncbi:MAG: hypothetical protein ACLSUW_03790 [Akkermansia sp.]
MDQKAGFAGRMDGSPEDVGTWLGYRYEKCGGKVAVILWFIEFPHQRLSLGFQKGQKGNGWLSVFRKGGTKADGAQKPVIDHVKNA